MTLEQFLATGEMTTSELASKAGLSEVSIWRIVNGKQSPPLKTMERIAKATGGKVMPNDFVGAW